MPMAKMKTMSSSRDSQHISSLTPLQKKKRDLRQIHKDRRAALLPNVKESHDAAIDDNLAELILSMKVSPDRQLRVAAYNPLPSEPGSANLAARLDEVARVFLPVCRDNGILEWGQFTADSSRRGPFGIIEPEPPYSPSSMLGELDAIIVPALAIDNQGLRLGKGAGFYDRALEEIAGSSIPLIGVIYSFEMVPDVPAEKHDLPVTTIVTELGQVTPQE